jgi:hypothetical protein
LAVDSEVPEDVLPGVLHVLEKTVEKVEYLTLCLVVFEDPDVPSGS